MLHCNFCGATISNEDKSCRTCGAAVSRAPAGVAAAVAGQRTRPLREWGSENTADDPLPALRQWDEPLDPLDVAPPVDTPAPQKRPYSRLRVYLLATVVAVLIVVAYMVVVGGDSGSNNAANEDNPPAGAATSTPEPADEPTTEREPGGSTSGPLDASLDPTGGEVQGANSLSLTFDPPPPSPTLAPALTN